ncbi:MAG TPA: apolipoprotein N-acyltransferase, partial [Elusimicrobia bacterium]|nr:apolipoprotein N-acyltransferase [Elusimicrobiota bacterium]
LSIPNPQSPNHRITQSPSLIIWPESAIPGYLLYERHLYEQVKKIIQQSNCYHLIGSVHYKKDKLYNSVFLFSPEGKLLAEYDRIHPVPFGETIPLKDFLSKYIKVLNELGDFSSGKDFTVFNLPLTTRHSPLTKFGVNICFEAIFPHLVRNFVKNGAEIIVNLTNDAWFLQTSAPYQHFTMNIFRAVENRRYVVRSANTGISAFIDPYGRVIKQTPIFITADLSEQIYPQKKMTFYTLYGDLFVWLGLGITLVFLANLLYIKKEVKNDVKRMGRKK